MAELQRMHAENHYRRERFLFLLNAYGLTYLAGMVFALAIIL